MSVKPKVVGSITGLISFNGPLASPIIKLSGKRSVDFVFVAYLSNSYSVLGRYTYREMGHYYVLLSRLDR